MANATFFFPENIFGKLQSNGMSHSYKNIVSSQGIEIQYDSVHQLQVLDNKGKRRLSCPTLPYIILVLVAALKITGKAHKVNCPGNKMDNTNKIL